MKHTKQLVVNQNCRRCELRIYIEHIHNFFIIIKTEEKKKFGLDSAKQNFIGILFTCSMRIRLVDTISEYD